MTIQELKLSYLSEEEIEAKAGELLKQSQQTQAPIDPVVVAESLDVPVYDAEFIRESTSGILRKIDGAFEILVNRHQPLTRQRFSIAHELGHYVLHGETIDRFVDTEVNLYRTGPLDDSRPKRREEIQANLFAAAILMPRSLLKSAVEVTEDLHDLARLFGVSHDAMAIRLGQLNLGSE